MLNHIEIKLYFFFLVQPWHLPVYCATDEIALISSTGNGHWKGYGGAKKGIFMTALVLYGALDRWKLAIFLLPSKVSHMPSCRQDDRLSHTYSIRWKKKIKSKDKNNPYKINNYLTSGLISMPSGRYGFSFSVRVIVLLFTVKLTHTPRFRASCKPKKYMYLVDFHKQMKYENFSGFV